MRAHLRFGWSLLRHKVFVFVAGRRTGVSLWRLIIHDWSKFTPSEWGPYARRFGSGRGGVTDKTGDPDEFHRAWAHHWHVNPHHWEHWLSISADGALRPMEMPERFVREMVADWMGAGRAYTGEWDITEWYGKHRDRIIITDATRDLVELVILDVSW